MRGGRTGSEPGMRARARLLPWLGVGLIMMATAVAYRGAIGNGAGRVATAIWPSARREERTA